MMEKKLSQNEKKRMIEDWNRKYPVGTMVIVTDDFGEKHEAVTESEAEMLGGHTPVIWTSYRPSCYLLTRVQPAN